MVTPAFGQELSGGEQFVYQLVKEYREEGHKVRVLTSDANRESDLWLGSGAGTWRMLTGEAGFEQIRCSIRPFPGGKSWLFGWRKMMVFAGILPIINLPIVKQMAKKMPALPHITTALNQLNPKPDIIHAWNFSWEYPALAAFEYAKIHKIPYAITPFAHINPGSKERTTRYVTMPHQREIFEKANIVLGLTAQVERGYDEVGWKARAFSAIGAGIETLPLNFGAEHLPRNVANLDSPFIAFLGRVNRDKGALDASRAVLKLRKSGVNLKLVLIGTVTEEFTKFHRALAPDEAEAIIRVGRQSEKAKHAILQKAEMLVLPSRTDALGLVLLEAWAHSKPVIGANAGGIPAVIDDGINGLLVEYGDMPALANAILQLHTNPDMREKFGQNGKEKVARQYQWPQVAAKVIQAYRQVIRAQS